MEILNSEVSEHYVCGAILKQPQKILEHCDTVGMNKEWFVNSTYRLIYQAACDLRFKGTIIEDASIINQLEKQYKGSGITSIMLDDCRTFCRTVNNAMYYILEMRDKYIKRCLADVMESSKEIIYSTKKAEEVVSEIKFLMNKCTPKELKEETPEQLINGIADRFELAQNNGHVGFPSRWTVLQDVIGSYMRGKVTVVGSRPKIGKTSFGLNEAYHLATKGIPVGFISLEMLEHELWEKMIGDDLGLDLFEYRKGTAGIDAISEFRRRGHDITKLPIYITTKHRTIEQIVTWIRDMAGTTQFIILDYIQRIRPSGFDPQAERERYARWSQMITDIANDTGVHILALAQLNREAEFDMKGNRILPQAKHLKGSGSFEQDAEKVILLARDLSLKDDEEWNDNQPTVIKVVYNRTGHTGNLDFVFQKSKQRLIPKALYVQQASMPRKECPF